MSLFSSIFTSTFTLGQFLIAVLASMVLGFVVSIYYMFRNTYSKSFVPSLILIPAIECVVIIMINGNMGAGIAVAGSFALIRFRSARGSAKDLTAIGNWYYLWYWLYWYRGTVHAYCLCCWNVLEFCEVW